METDTRTTVAPAFHSDDVENVAAYRSLSVLSILSLIVGLLSWLCLFFPLFLGLAGFGVILSLLALRRIDASEGQLAGRWAAMAGLVLCVTFAAAAFARGAVTRYLRTSHAESATREFLDLVTANDTELAFKKTLQGNQAPPPPAPGEPAPTTTPYETFLNDPLIKKLVAAGKDAEIQYDGTLEYTAQSGNSFYLRQRYSVTPQSDSPNAGEAEPIDVAITIQRSRLRGDSNPRWLIIRFEKADAAANDSAK